MVRIRMVLDVPHMHRDELLEAVAYVADDPLRTEPYDAMDVLMQIANADLQVEYVVVESEFVQED